MFINHTSKYVYLRVPKTGSTSFEAQLIEDTDKHNKVMYTQIPFCNIPSNNWDYSSQQSNFTFIVNNPHLTLGEITQLLTDDISSYDVYGVLRNPVDRFISRAYHMEYFQWDDNSSTTRPADTTLTNNEIVMKWLNYVEMTPAAIETDHMYKPQSEWLSPNGQLINNIFLYENLPAMMQKITGQSTLRYNYRNQSRVNKNYDDLAPGLADRINQLYEADYNLYTQLKNATP